MYQLFGIFCYCLLLASCTQNAASVDNIPQNKFIQAYFNHRETETSTYIDPYRQSEHSGDNLEAVIIEEIATAKSTIDLAVQELNLPRIAQALAKKHQSGVKVRVILDNNYSRSLAELSLVEVENLPRRDRQKYEQFLQLVDIDRNGQLNATEIDRRDAINILKRAGIEIIDDSADGSKGSGLMHHKFIVVDRQTVITGSANFTLSGLLGDMNNLASKGNVNHLLRIDNDRVANLFRQEFDYMWGDAERGIESKFGLAKPWRSPETVSWNDTSLTIQFAPTSQKQFWSSTTNGLIAQTVQSATKSIDLALFVFSEQELADVLQIKSQLGVAVRGVFDTSFAYRYYSEVLDMLGLSLYFNCRTEANNNPWINPLDTVGTTQLNSGDKLHHKFTVIDNKILVSGSQNWSQAANQINDEVVIVINDMTVAKHFKREFQRLYSQTSFEVPLKIKQKMQQQSKQCN